MLFSLLGLAFTLVAAPAQRPPNIIVILGDDIGYGDFGCNGATAVKTPNVDRVAREGLRFTSAYASSATCTPSRYSLLTGEYAFRKKGTGILPGDAALIIEPGRATLPSLLKRAGYSTGVVGKWHLGLGDARGADWNGEIQPGPLEVGFDYSFIIAATGDRVPCVYIENHRVVGLLPGDPIFINYKEAFPGEPTGVEDRAGLKLDWSEGHNQAVINGIGRIGYMKGGKAALWKDEDMADQFTRHALEFIERVKDKPFFLYFATHDIHVPRVPNPRFVGQTSMGARGDAIVEFDACVGRILDTLDRFNLAENTLVILSSDNGPVLDDGYKDLANEKLGNHKPAGPFRAGKYSLFEGGTRMPFLVRWPGRVKPGVSDALVSQVDLAASLAALTGQKPDPLTMPDSVNVLPALLGESKTGRAWVVEHANRLALRDGDWKFITPGRVIDRLGPWTQVTAPDPGFLFDLANDPGETNDLAPSRPEKVRELGELLATIRHSPSSARADGWMDVSSALLARLTNSGIKPAWPGGCSGVVADRQTGAVTIKVVGCGLWRSPDQGATWRRIDEDLVSGRDETGWATSADQNAPTRLASFSLDGLAGWTPDGRHWKSFASLGRNWDFGSVDWGAEPPGTMIAAKHETTPPGEVYATTNGGVTWTKLAIHLNENRDRVSMLGALDAGTFVYSRGDGIYRSTDTGATWAKVSAANPQTRIPVLFRGTHYLGSAAGLLVSTDKGASWRPQGGAVNVWQGPFFGRDEKEILVVGSDGVFTTKDAGRTWTRAAGLKPKQGDYVFSPNWFGCYAWDPTRGILYASAMGNPVYKLQLAPSADPSATTSNQAH